MFSGKSPPQHFAQVIFFCGQATSSFVVAGLACQETLRGGEGVRIPLFLRLVVLLLVRVSNKTDLQ